MERLAGPSAGAPDHHEGWEAVDGRAPDVATLPGPQALAGSEEATPKSPRSPVVDCRKNFTSPLAKYTPPVFGLGGCVLPSVHPSRVVVQSTVSSFFSFQASKKSSLMSGGPAWILGHSLTNSPLWMCWTMYPSAGAFLARLNTHCTLRSSQV